ncbi:Major_facilitator superfamily protein [Hexamita inflata]|uniref:Major_facilitator superfamily protein n=1 Tax=Hexamita inflata TaxID=28002 RepID=A0ABP1H2L4_9EUKA
MWKLSLIVIPVVLLYASQYTQTNQLLNIVRKQYDLDIAAVSWLLSVEPLCAMMLVIWTQHFISKFGVPQVLLFSLFIFSVSCLSIVFVMRQFYLLVLVRVFQSIGAALMLTSCIPFTFLFCEPEKVASFISIISLVIPLGQVLISFALWLFCSVSSWQYLNFMLGCIALCLIILSFVLVPYRFVPKRPILQAKQYGLLLLVSGLITTRLAVEMFPVNVILFGCLLALGVVLLASFLFLNAKKETYRLFGATNIGTQVQRYQAIIVMSSILHYSELLILSQMLTDVLKYDQTAVCVTYAVCNCISIFCSPIINLVSKRMLSKTSTLMFTGIFAASVCFNMIQIILFNNVYGYVAFVFITTFCNLGVQSVLQTTIFAQNPDNYIPLISTINQFSLHFGNFLGVGIFSLVINTIHDKIVNIKEIIISYICLSGISIIMVVLTVILFARKKNNISSPQETEMRLQE